MSSVEVPADLDAALRAVVVGRLRDRGMSGNALATAVGKASSSFSRQLRGFGLFSVQDWSDIAVALGDDLEGLLEDARQRLRHLSEQGT